MEVTTMIVEPILLALNTLRAQTAWTSMTGRKARGVYGAAFLSPRAQTWGLLKAEVEMVAAYACSDPRHKTDVKSASYK